MRLPVLTNRTWCVALAAVAFLAIALPVAWDVSGRVEALWPVRNIMAHDVAGILTAVVPVRIQAVGTGSLRGTVHDDGGRPVPGATLLVAMPDGSVIEARTLADGTWTLTGIPVGRHPVWIGAPGFATVTMFNRADAGITGHLRAWFEPGIEVTSGMADARTSVNVVLAPETPPIPVPDTPETVMDATEATLSCERPVASTARRSDVTIPRMGVPSGEIFRYRADDNADTSHPVVRRPLLVVYPGPASQWDCASIPLASAGFEVIAYGPPYTFAIEREIRILRLLLASLGMSDRADRGAESRSVQSRPAILAGSYSAIHALRVVQDTGPGIIGAVVLMGPPVDLLDLRHRLETGDYRPPFGLERALIALGVPDREVARHARYSARLHVTATHPPTLVIHSRSDDVVPVAQGEAYLSALRDAGVDAEGMILDGGGHYLLSTGGGEAAAILSRTVSFLMAHP
ncbi:MAG: hypothetical protein EXR45_07715 [Chloroflexi bacterium]|nr:hypothetical protein [Chloroflexota bacterium]